MFDQTFVTTAAQRTRQPYTVLASTLLQAAVILGFTLASLLYTRALPMAQLKSMLVAPPPPTNLPKPPGPTVRHVSVVPRLPHFQDLIAPVAIPKQVARINDAPAAPDITGAQSAGAADGAGSTLLFGSSGSALPVAQEPRPPVKPAKPDKPLRFGGSIAEANLIHRVQPVYPPLAKAARIQGTVEFTALISKDGRIENLKLVSGHPLLVNAAREAILQWQYRPTLLNGEPVEVVTSIVVHFSLSE
ncbi:MAG TPA: TonB family protein [Bryobacteraceae bacterium]|jgi:protein TonB|nr:TonB family protein [Bryobacteraceae bacterium]